MNPSPDRPAVQIGSMTGLLAAIPRLLGFAPENSMVVLGITPGRGLVKVMIRYDLPGTPAADLAEDISQDAACRVRHSGSDLVGLAVGYGPGPLVTPVADAIRASMPAAGLHLAEVLRVEDGRYWSYLCREPSCCPAAGVLFDIDSHPVTAALVAAGMQALPSRSALAATIAPLTGSGADVMAAQTRHAEHMARSLFTRDGLRGLTGRGLAAVQAAIGTNRDGGSITRAFPHAWLAVALTSLRIRDDAWARMDPRHCQAHQRLWTDVVRRVRPGYVAAPASLLAFTAWQSGNGVLASIAVERALDDVPGYSMALLLREALDSGAPPSVARLPMTPAEVAASYGDPAGIS
jgi:hypothetical protein